MHEIRWNPLIRQWVIVAAHRAARPWRPEDRGAEFRCPFCPGAPELRHLDKWDVVVLPNKYPALVPEAPPVEGEGLEAYAKREARGVAEVIVETPDHEGDLHTLSLQHAAKVVKAFRDEIERLSKLDFVQYVAAFRNKGKEIGVSLTHPHSQIYALPFVPPRIAAEVESMEAYRRARGSCMICDIVKYELSLAKRAIYKNEGFAVILPYYAMWPYELHVYPLEHRRSVTEMSERELELLADALRAVTSTYAALLKRDAPYIMAFHEPPAKLDTDFHFHVEFYQPYRDREKLKYAAGIEWGYWVFTYDGVPEERAGELKAACREAVKSLDGALGECAP